MLIALILAPIGFAALSLTLALQSSRESTRRQAQEPEMVWSEFTTIMTDPSLQAVTAFSLIGFLLTLNFILRFPDLGILIEQYNQF
jgi:hypothetical protein